MKICIEGDNIIEDVELCKGFFEKLRGLMFRDAGRILLSFSRSDRHSIWMPFMRFSLDIAFIDAEKRVVDVEKDVPPVSVYPSTWRVYRPSRPCRYILEVESGLLEEKGVAVGDTVDFQAHGSNSRP